MSPDREHSRYREAMSVPVANALGSIEDGIYFKKNSTDFTDQLFR